MYARVDGKELAFDLYLPTGVPSPPLLVWVHGGAWTTGSKVSVPPVFVANGFAVASVDFRQSTEARFPAQVHDIKAAIRYLRANAPAYGYRADKIAIAGDSSGGHLAALVGVTNGHRELEGTVGDNPKQASSIQAIVSYYGASDLRTILAQSTLRAQHAAAGPGAVAGALPGSGARSWRRWPAPSLMWTPGIRR